MGTLPGFNFISSGSLLAFPVIINMGSFPTFHSHIMQSYQLFSGIFFFRGAPKRKLKSSIIVRKQLMIERLVLIVEDV